MDIYTIIGWVITAIAIVIIIKALIIFKKGDKGAKGTKGNKGKKSLWKRIKNIFDNEPHVPGEKPRGGGTIPLNNTADNHEWTVKIIDESAGKELSTGFLDENYFISEASDEREKHFEIGRGNGNLQVPEEEEYRGISQTHGYIRYDKGKRKYVYWDISGHGTYKECYGGTDNRIIYIEVSNGLKLYIAKNVYVEFTKN